MCVIRFREACEVTSLALTLLTWGIALSYGTHSWNVLRMATWWVMAIQLLYFFSAIVLSGKRAYLRELRHVGRLLSVMMCTVFWLVFFYDRELIMPRAMRHVFGLNFLQHFLPPVLFMMAPDGEERRPKFVYSVLVTLAYFAVVLAWYAARGSWPYLFMHGLTIKSFQALVCFSLLGIWGIHKLISQ